MYLHTITWYAAMHFIMYLLCFQFSISIYNVFFSMGMYENIILFLHLLHNFIYVLRNQFALILQVDPFALPFASCYFNHLNDCMLQWPYKLTSWILVERVLSKFKWCQLECRILCLQDRYSRPLEESCLRSHHTPFTSHTPGNT